jgi:hypothetical protein
MISAASPYKQPLGHFMVSGMQLRCRLYAAMIKLALPHLMNARTTSFGPREIAVWAKVSSDGMMSGLKARPRSRMWGE